MNRHLLRLALIAIAAALSSCSQERPAAPSAAPRDVILVTIDTMRADAAGFAGNARVKTPFLDSLAARGVVFTNAHAHNVVTLPSHANILTGLHPFQHGVRENAGFVLRAGHPTVATMLRGAGYATGAFVSAFPLDARFGLNAGFDTYDDNYGKGAVSADFVMQERRADLTLAAAMRWWKAHAGRKRFLWIHLFDPHAPYLPPEPFASTYRETPYLGEVAWVDSVLKAALDPLLGGEGRPLLIVTSDHGEALGEHGEQTHGLFAYEPTLRIPLVVDGPGLEHRVEASYVRHIDIAPTILEAAGVRPPSPLPGLSLLTPAGERETYFEALSASLNRGWAPLTGIIQSSGKYIDLPLPEFYDLPRDPREAQNLRAERRREVEAARRRLAELTGSQAAPVRSNVGPEEAARLRALGYVSGAAAPRATYTAEDDPKTLVHLDRKMHDAVEAFQRRDLARALRLAREVVSARPGMAAGHELYAFMLQEADRPADAVEQLRAAIASGTASDSQRVQLALLYTELNDPGSAIELLAPRLSATSDPDVINAYGVALADAGREAEAAAQFERVLRTDPNNAPALQNLGILALKRGDAAAARANLLRALELNPRLPLALNTLGVVHANGGDYARALDAWEQAVTLDPRQYDALFNLGMVAARTGDRQRARRALLQFIETAPRSRYASDIAAAQSALRRP